MTREDQEIEVALTEADSVAGVSCAAPAGYARPTLRDLRDHLKLLRDGLTPAKHMAYRQTGEHVQICQNLEVCAAALTATIMAVEAQIKAHTEKALPQPPDGNGGAQKKLSNEN